MDDGQRVGSQREYADWLGSSEQYVSALKSRGLLVMVASLDGVELVDFEASDALVAGARDPALEVNRERWRREKGRPAAGDVAGGEADQVGDPSEGAARGSVTQELYLRRLRAQVQAAEREAQIKEIELQQRAGDLVSVAKAREERFAAGRFVRDTVLSIESRMAAHLNAEQLTTLRKETRALLDELEQHVRAR